MQRANTFFYKCVHVVLMAIMLVLVVCIISVVRTFEVHTRCCKGSVDGNVCTVLI